MKKDNIHRSVCVFACFYQVSLYMVHKLNEYPNSVEVILLLLFKHLDSGIMISRLFLSCFDNIPSELFDFFEEHPLSSCLYANKFEFEFF